MSSTSILPASPARKLHFLVAAIACGLFVSHTFAVRAAGAQTTMTPTPPAMSGHASADAAQLLVNFVTSVNRDEIAMGKLAVSKASTAEVRAYAQRIVDDHTNAMAAWADKVPSWSLKIPDSASTVTQSVKAAAGSAAMANGVSEVRDTTTGLRGGTTASAIHSTSLKSMEELKTLTGPAFDKAYLTAERANHEAVLKELTVQTNAYTDMQTLLALFRTTVEKHSAEVGKLQP